MNITDCFFVNNRFIRQPEHIIFHDAKEIPGRQPVFVQLLHGLDDSVKHSVVFFSGPFQACQSLLFPIRIKHILTTCTAVIVPHYCHKGKIVIYINGLGCFHMVSLHDDTVFHRQIPDFIHMIVGIDYSATGNQIINLIHFSAPFSRFGMFQNPYLYVLVILYKTMQQLKSN